MGIKVLFIYPNNPGMILPPPALALFSAILKQEGHKMEIFDLSFYSTGFGINSDGSRMENLNVVPFDMGKKGGVKKTDWKSDLKSQIKRFQPDLIGITSTEDMWELGMRVLDEIKEFKIKNKIPVIAGGVFCTFAPDLCIKEPLVDMVCVGEGENALVDLCKKIEKGDDYSNVTNLWVKKENGEIVKNRVAQLVDINHTPQQDLSIFEESRFYRPMAGKIYKIAPVETHRGCPFTCAFCNSPDQQSFYKKETGSSFFRKKKTEKIYEDLKYSKEKLGIEYNFFWADTFLAWNGRELDEFCEMYKSIGLPFWIQTRPETVTEEKLKKLQKVGLNRMAFGIEHGNEDFRLKMLDRRWKNKDIIAATNIPKKLGIQFSVNNITGFPNETRELAFDTIELNRHIASDNQNIYSFAPFHGTPLRKVAEKMGLIKHDTITKCLTNKPQLELPTFPHEVIEGVKRCFPLYVKFPKSRWKEIEKAEKFDDEGNKIYNELKQEHIEKFFPKAEEDLTGGTDSKEVINNEISQVSDDIKRGYADELN